MRCEEIEVSKVHTDDNLADILTKVLDRDPFEKLRRVMMQLLRIGVTMSTFLSPKHRGKAVMWSADMISVASE